MKRKLNENCLLKFADLVLNPLAEEVLRDEERLSLPKLSYLLLKVLAEHSPKTFTQEELISSVWVNKVVGDETVKQRVKLLRQVLGDSVKDPKYIGMVRGRGYYLIPKVTYIEQPLASNSGHTMIFHERIPDLTSVAGMKIWKRMSIALSAVLISLISVMYVMSFQLVQHKSEQSFFSSVRLDSDKFGDVLGGDSKFQRQAYGYFLKGQHYYQRYIKQDNEIAIQFYQHALELEPNFALAHAGLADAYSQGVFQFGAEDSWRLKALISAKNAVRLAPDSEAAYKALGLAEYLNGQLGAAIEDNLRAVEISPNFLQANTNLGFFYRERGQLDKAIEWNNKTITIDPFYAPGYLHLAQSYQAQGKIELANRNYLKALELKPDYQLAIESYRRFRKQYRPTL